MYRIDSEIVQPCMQGNLQPPYCDAQSPTLIGQRRLTAVTRPVVSTTTTTSQISKLKSHKNNNEFLPPSFPSEPSRITPVFPIVESRQEVCFKTLNIINFLTIIFHFKIF